MKEHVNEYGYTSAGVRVPLRYGAHIDFFFSLLHHDTLTTVIDLRSTVCASNAGIHGVIGALGVVALGPMMDPTRQGDLGLFCYTAVPGRALDTPDIVQFFETQLGPQLNAFPGPRSVVILDNAPGHRALAHNAQVRILTAVQRRGALLIWNPPHSPDLNPIEHIWNVTKKLCERRLIELATGQHGAARAFAFGDLIACLQRARLSREAYRSLLRQPI